MPRLKKNEVVVEFYVPRVFTDQELADFHEKRKRFVSERGFDYDNFAVAYGAFIKKEIGGVNHYMIPHKTEVNGNVMEGEKRYAEMVNLLEQHDRWFRKQDSYTESLVALSEQIDF